MPKKESEAVLVLKKQVKLKSQSVNIENDAMLIVDNLRAKSGLTATYIVSEMIRFASKHVVIEV